MAVGYSQGLLNNASKTEMPVLSMKNTLFRVYPPGGGVYPRTCVFGGGVQQTPIIHITCDESWTNVPQKPHFITDSLHTCVRKI